MAKFHVFRPKMICFDPKSRFLHQKDIKSPYSTPEIRHFNKNHPVLGLQRIEIHAGLHSSAQGKRHFGFQSDLCRVVTPVES